LLENFRIFPKLIGLSALLVAGSAAFFSVFGLSKLFAGATLSVVIMAGSLEFAKLISASFLYRYWKSINVLMRSYLTVAIVTLVLITSAGIFGFLSNAYQGATINFEKQSTALLYKEDRLEQLEDDKTYLKEELEQSIASLPDNYPTAKRKLREEYNPKVLALNDEILGIKQEIGDLKVGLIETGVDVGPAIYLARAFETDIDTVVKFFIFILIFVFDPLAVALVVAYNVAITGNRKWEVYGEKKRKEIIDESFTKYESHREDFKPKDKVIFKGDEKTFVTTDNLSKGGRKVV
tara:strand:+ start:64 stop:942 length:879 start_codon:yes stop_codon:yes gene_type:complete